MRSDAAPFSKIYAELYFDAKRLEKGLNWGGGGENFGALFFKKGPFLVNNGRCPDFLD